MVFDAVGKSSFRACLPLLKKRGIYVSTEFGWMVQNPFLALLTPLFGGKRVLFPLPRITQDDVVYFQGLLASGQFRPLIDRHYPLADIQQAFAHVLTGMKVGNVIVVLPAAEYAAHKKAQLTEELRNS
jgi:NADPH:quinone reductase-like Zn-dependent oxidoreductase